MEKLVEQEKDNTLSFASSLLSSWVISVKYRLFDQTIGEFKREIYDMSSL